MTDIYVGYASVYIDTGTAQHINAKHPKLCGVCRKFIYVVGVIAGIALVYRVVLSVYQVFISNEIDGYAADIAAAIYYNLFTLIYGLLVLVMLYMIFYVEKPGESGETP